MSCRLNLGEMILQSPRAHGSAPLRSAMEGPASENRGPQGRKINYPAASSGVFCVMPDLIRHPVRVLDSGVRRNDGTRGKPRGMHP